MLAPPDFVEVEFSIALNLNLPKPLLIFLKCYNAFSNNLYPVIDQIDVLLAHPFFKHNRWVTLLNGGDAENKQRSPARLIKTATNYYLNVCSEFVGPDHLDLFFDLINPYVVAEESEIIGTMKISGSVYFDLAYAQGKIYASLADEASEPKRVDLEWNW